MSQQTSKFYNRFRVLYPLVDVFLKPQKRRLISQVNAQPAGQLLEVGVGNGSHLPLYQGHHITGIDTSAGMLAVAARHQQFNIRLLQMNGESLLFKDETFDYVVLSHVIAVVNDPDQLLQEVFRVLKPQGKLFILNHITPNNWLQYVDSAFQLFSGLLHFKSVFKLSQFPAIGLFKLLHEEGLRPWGYFKIYIYQKAMKNLLWLIIPSLLISLFIYLFYRTDKTVVIDIFMAVFSRSAYYSLRSAVNHGLPLPDLIVYSLPEGLWVFCITLTSKPYYLKAGRLQFSLMYLPLVFSVGLELLQLVHITNGRFDWLDIASAVLFWALGMLVLPHRRPLQNPLRPFTAQSLLCLISYVIVFFAHVWK